MSVRRMPFLNCYPSKLLAIHTQQIIDARDGRSCDARPDRPAIHVPSTAIGRPSGGLGGVGTNVGEPTDAPLARPQPADIPPRREASGGHALAAGQLSREFSHVCLGSVRTSVFF